MKKIIHISIWVLLIIGLVVMLGFVEKEQKKLLGKELNINIEESDNFFVEESDVKELLKEKGDSIIEQPISTINAYKIEHVLNSHASIANSEVSVTGNGIVKIEIKQRKPIVRIFTDTKESYYLDSMGKAMPLSEKYTARIIVANGFIHEPYAKLYMYSIEDINKNEYAKQQSVLDDLFLLATFIEKDSFWKAQIGQIYVNEEKEFELIPLVGNHTIIFGNALDVEEKFKKLKILYLEALNKTGWWNKYATINLSYKNQIVCTKK